MQIDQLVVAQLLFLAAGRGCVVELHGTDWLSGSALHLKDEEGAANGDLIAGSWDALLDGDAVDECPGAGVQVSKQEAFILESDLAVTRRNGHVFDTNWIGGVSADGQRRREAEFGLSEGTAESYELRLHG